MYCRLVVCFCIAALVGCAETPPTPFESTGEIVVVPGCEALNKQGKDRC